MTALTIADIPLRFRQSEDEATLRAALDLAEFVEQSASEWLTGWLRDGLETAASPVELKVAWARVLRYGHSVPTEALLDVAARRLWRLRKSEAQHARAQQAVAA